MSVEAEQPRFIGFSMLLETAPFNGRVMTELLIEWKVKLRDTVLPSKKAVLAISGCWAMVK